jgi:hypothetical protein
MRMFRHFPKRRDIPGILFVLLLVAGLIYLNLKYPNWHASSGFGPEWQCTSTSGRPSFCIKRPVTEPAKQE